MVQLSPKECVLFSGEGGDLPRVRQVVERSGVLITERKKGGVDQAVSVYNM